LLEAWRRTGEEIRQAIDTHGYDASRGIFVQAFGSSDLDASLLLLPRVGYVAYDDPRMVRTVDAIRKELAYDGWLVRRRPSAPWGGVEGAFLACTFWLSECLAHQGRIAEAREIFHRAEGLASDLGLFAEQYDPRARRLLGNFPQGLSHHSHISAAATLGYASSRAPALRPLHGTDVGSDSRCGDERRD